MELHPYDGVERRFRHTDDDTAQGRAVVAEILGLPQPPPSPELRYDLSLYSGGIGAFELLAVALPFSADTWSAIVVRLDARTPEHLVADPVAGDDFRWLVLGDQQDRDIRPAAAAFANDEKASFQNPCTDADELRFGSGSDVNDWTVIWRTANQLNFRGFSQG